MSPPASYYPKELREITHEKIVTDKGKNIFIGYFFKDVIRLTRKKEFNLRLIMHYLEPKKFLKPVELEISRGGKTNTIFERKDTLQAWCPTSVLPSLEEINKKIMQSNLVDVSKGALYELLIECKFLEKEIEGKINPQNEFGNPQISATY